MKMSKPILIAIIAAAMFISVIVFVVSRQEKVSDSHVEDAVKAANISLTADEAAELESVADSLGLNVIRFWEKEMK